MSMSIRLPLLWALTIAFFLRVAAQALQYWSPQPFLPPFEDFQGSNLPYAALFPSQLLILGTMLYNCVKLQTHELRPSVRIGHVLFWFGAVYMVGSVLRLLVGVSVPAAPEWFRAWISVVFHLVLAGFVLTLASYHLKGGRVA